ncbi:MAG: hypothetical protein IT170_08915 [Bryobacterales bacterium]|nr:hypothetical protein [Bryobacterales bacterium]
MATRQTRQLGYTNLNWSPIGGGNNGRVLFQRFGRSADTREVIPVGGSHYDSLQTRLQRRFSNNYSLNASYTFGKAISTSGLARSDSTLSVIIPEYYYLNRSVSQMDRRHNFQLTNIYQLPFGKGQRYLNGDGIASAVFGGWQTNSIVSLMSGRPFSVTSSATSLNSPGNTQRADQIKANVEILGGVGRGQPYFDPTAFQQVTAPRFGNAGYYSMRGPGRVNWDFGLFRFFQINERVKMEARIEAFNFTNTPKFGMPGANVSNLQFSSSGAISNLNGFGEITSATEERQLQAGFRITF